MIVYIKDPDAISDYAWDWASFLGSDTITISMWLIDSADLIIVTDSNDATTTTVRLFGGILETSYTVTNRIVTGDGRTNDRSFRIRIKQQ